MYKCIEDIVLVLPIDSQGETTNGGIIMPGKMKERPVTGTVVAVGEGVKMEDGNRFPMSLHVGDIVVFPAKSGDTLYLDGLTYIAIRVRYVLLVVDSPDEEEEEDCLSNRHDKEAIYCDSQGNIIPKEEQE